MVDYENIDWNDWYVYDETSPSCLRWKDTRYANSHIPRVVVSAGDVAGCFNKTTNYWHVKLFSKSFKAHRIVYEMHSREKLGKRLVDHIDGDTNNNMIGNLRKCTDYVNAKNKSMYKNNNTGYTGVRREESDARVYYAATWYTIDKISRSKRFNVAEYGEDLALKLAIDYRAKMIEELNLQGAGYTERHGGAK